MRRIGLDPAEPYVLYTCSNPAMTEHAGVEFVLAWIEALRVERRRAAAPARHRRSARIRTTLDQWREVELSAASRTSPSGRARDALPVTDEARADFFDSLAHSAAVVGINTTAMIEAAIVGKSVLTVLAPEFAQESTLHFDYLLEENGGFLHVAAVARRARRPARARARRGRGGRANGGAASSSRSSARTGSTGRRRRSSPTRSRSSPTLPVERWRPVGAAGPLARGRGRAQLARGVARRTQAARRAQARAASEGARRERSLLLRPASCRTSQRRSTHRSSTS